VEARGAILLIRGGIEAQEENAALMMLSDLKDALAERGGEITSQAFREGLVAMEDRPWSSWRRGQEITYHGIGKLLATFGITTRKLPTGEGQARGYVLDSVAEDAFARYLSIGLEASQSAREAPGADETHLSEASQDACESESKRPGTLAKGPPEPHGSRPKPINPLENHWRGRPSCRKCGLPLKAKGEGFEFLCVCGGGHD
jgi:hypothetical protein